MNDHSNVNHGKKKYRNTNYPRYFVCLVFNQAQDMVKCISYELLLPKFQLI